MASKEHDFSVGSIPRNIISLALPMTAAQLINVLYSVVDRIYLGRLPGHLALTGLGVCFPVILFVSAVSALVGQGGASRAVVRMGEGKHDLAESILGNCTMLLILLSAAVTAVFLLIQEPMLYLFGATEETIGYAMDYLTIYLLGTIFVELSLGLNYFITSQGFSTTAMATVIIGAVINIVLDPVFIFGFGMGVQGAALATIIGQIVSGIMVIIYFSRFFKTVDLTLSTLIPSFQHCKDIVRLGMAPCFNQLAMMVVQIAMNNILRYYGAQSSYGSEIPLACAGIISKVNMIFYSMCIGISQGLQPIVSFNYGAKKYHRVREAYLKAAAAATIASCAAFLCFHLFPRQIIGFFGSGSEEYFRFAEQYFKIFLFFTFINGLQPVSSNFFTSIGKAAKGIFLSLTRQIIFLLPLIIILPMFMGIGGVMYSAPVADFMAAVLVIIFITREMRLLNRMIDKEGVLS